MSMVQYNESTGIYSSSQDAVNIPDDMMIDQFMFEFKTSSKYPIPRPKTEGATWLIDSSDGRTLSFEDCIARSQAIAKAFHGEYGVGKEDKEAVAVFSGNEVDFAVSVWGSFRLGAAVSCANPQYGKDELSFQLKLVNEHYKVKLLLTNADGLVTALGAIKDAGLPKSHVVLIKPIAGDAPSEVKAASKGVPTLDELVKKHSSVTLPTKIKLKPGEAKTKVAFISFSSGTTGLPKGTLISHRNVIANTSQMSAYWTKSNYLHPYDPKTKKGDISIGCLPFFHIYGLVVVLHCNVFFNVPVVTMSKFSLPGFLDTIQKNKITSLWIVPPMVVAMAKHPMIVDYDLSSLKKGMVGAAPMSDELYKAFKKRFPRVLFGQGYGMTETSTVISCYDASSNAELARGSSAGCLVPNVDAKVVTPEGKPLPFGGVGELWARSPSNAMGYLANKKATDDTFDSEGFVHTGDEVYIDKEGWMYVVDRIKELIKVKGNQVAPAELEGHLLDHPDIADVCCIGIPDERAGERPKAYVALAEGAKARTEKDEKAKAELITSIKKWVSDKKIAYKHLAEVEILEVIPKTASGKLLRKDLRKLHAETAGKNKSKL